MALSMGSYAQNGNLILTTPDYGLEYMVSKVSPNGKWACGTIMEGGLERGFRWNLTTGEIKNLSVEGSVSKGMAVSNDGIVAGCFETTENTANNIPTLTYGYWKEGTWYALDLEDCETGDMIMREGYPGTISPNGRYIGGIALTGKTYNPVVWEDGKLRIIDDIEGSVYDISKDGKIACGWTTHPEKKNRTSVIWTKNEDGTYSKTCLDLDSQWSAGPFSVATDISPNDKYVVEYNTIFNLTSGATFTHDMSDALGGFQFNGVFDDGSVYGYVDTGDYPGGPDKKAVKITPDHERINLRDYFMDMGIDLSAYPYIQDAISISDDEKTYALGTYDEYFQPCTIIIKLDANIQNMAPISLSCRQINGLGSSLITWKAPIKNAENVKGYNLYRDGVKVNDALITSTEYTDTKLSAGEYKYEVTAIYNDGNESEKSEAAMSEISDKQYQEPRQLMAFQAGMNDARLLWDAPYSNLPAVRYYGDDDLITGLGGAEFSFEGAIAARASELALYKNEGYKIAQISFIPRTRQTSWTVNFYTSDNDDTPIYSEVIPSENLQYGVENFFTLSEPLEIPDGKDVIMGIAVDATNYGGYDVLGMSGSNADAGYSDLIRQEGENDFYSLYDRAINDEYPYEFNLCWAMGMHFAKEGSNNEIKQYMVSANGEQLGTATDKKFSIENLEDGNYKFDVVAEYTDGEKSTPATTELKIKANKKVCTTITPNVEPGDGMATVTWNAPTYNDEAIISYANNKCDGGVLPKEHQNYCYTVGTIYKGEKLRPYEDFEITGFRFYPLGDASFTFRLSVNGEEVAFVPVERETGYVKNQWNTIKLEEPIKINRFDEYFLMLDCNNTTPEEFPVGLDSQKCLPRHSDLISTDGGFSFSSLSLDAGKDANWMIGMEVASTEKKNVAVDGYNVYLCDELQNDAPIAETTHVLNNLAKGEYQVRVNPVYGGSIGEMESEDVTFVIDIATGIENISNKTFEVTRDADQIKVNGGNVSAISVYATNGALAAQNNCNTVNIASLAKGVYVLKIQMDGKSVTTKISIM